MNFEIEQPRQVEQGEQAPTPWYEGHGLEAEDIGYIQNRKFDGIAGILNNVREFEKIKGVPADQLLKLPKDEQDTEGWNAIYSRLGRPEKADDYSFDAPEDIALDDERMGWVRDVAHKLGLNKSQFHALINETLAYEGGLISEAQKSIELAQTAELEEVKREWGQAFEERAELGRRAARIFLPGDASQKQALMNAMETTLGTGVMLKLFANIGEKLGEDKIPAGDEGSRPFGYTKEQALSDIKGLMEQLRDPANKDRLSAYNSARGKDYEKMRALQKIAYGAVA